MRISIRVPNLPQSLINAEKGRIGSSNAVLVPWSGKSSSAPELDLATAEDTLHQTVAEQAEGPLEIQYTPTVLTRRRIGDALHLGSTSQCNGETIGKLLLSIPQIRAEKDAAENLVSGYPFVASLLSSWPSR